MKRLRNVIIALLGMVLLSCGSNELRVDATTEETFETSVQQMAEKLKPEKAMVFQTAMGLHALSSIDWSAMLGGEDITDGAGAHDLFGGEDIHGMTAQEVIDFVMNK